MKFLKFRDLVNAQFNALVNTYPMLYVTGTTKSEIWEVYQNAFPEGTNPVYRERPVHECNTCRQFMRPYANVVAINSKNELISIWDIEAENEYKEVALELSKYVKSKPVVNVFLADTQKFGTKENFENANGDISKWVHFYFIYPKAKVQSAYTIPTTLNGYRTNFTMLKKLVEYSIHSVETVLSLIKDNSIYRGAEHLKEVQSLHKFLGLFPLDLQGDAKLNKLWTESIKNPHLASSKNSVIGTLIEDIADGVDLETAVLKYEKKVAPENYKRSKALYTKSQINKFREMLEVNGYKEFLDRRHASIEDVSIVNVMFADRSIKHLIGEDALEDLLGELPDKVSTKKAVDITIEKFLSEVLPKSKELEVLMLNDNIPQLVNIVAASNKDAKSMLKWDNQFTWAYKGGTTDSIKESVERRGGKTDGYMRFSIQWKDNNDLDAHCDTPNMHISFREKRCRVTRGALDIDITKPAVYNGKDIVENITFPELKHLVNGEYRFKVHNYALRTGGNTGFTAELQIGDKLFYYKYPKGLKNKELVDVVSVIIKDSKILNITHYVKSTDTPIKVWGVSTHKFNRVSAVMLSPNHWNTPSGNKHYMFILDKCINPEPVKGFFNEYLKHELKEYRKVLEALSEKMQVSHSDTQLAGLGFSSTMENKVTVRVNKGKLFNIKFN